MWHVGWGMERMVNGHLRFSFVVVLGAFMDEGVDGMGRIGISLLLLGLFIDGCMHNSSYVSGVSIQFVRSVEPLSVSW